MHTVRSTDTVKDAWRVFKFGGSSVADAACMERVAAIIEGEPAGPLAVVLSASRGVTDALLTLVAAAERQEDTAPALAGLRTRHADMAAALCPEAEARAYTSALDADCQDVAACCRRCGWRGRPRPPRATSSSGSGSCGLPAFLPAPWWRAAGGPASAGWMRGT